MSRNPSFNRSPLPPDLFSGQAMSRNSGENISIPMSSMGDSPEYSRTYNCESDARPNRVISGHRKFNTVYTGPRANYESHANKIVAKMEQEKTLMEDTPISEELRKKALRDLPQCLTMKRCVKKKLSKSVSLKSKHRPIGAWKRLKYRISIKWAKFKSSFKHFNYFELWHGTLKDIESHFGSGYASYFKFLRWLLVMDFLTAALSFSLIAVPQIIYDASGANGTRVNNEGFEIKNLFVGDGFFKETILYYGHYTHNTITFISYFYFNMPAAYFSVTVISYIISFIVLGVSVALSYRRTFIETEGGLQNVYANKIFCSWDYGIATSEAAELKSSAIYHELKELLSESMAENWDRSRMYKFWTTVIQIVVNVLILCILVGIGWLSWLLIDKFSTNEQTYITMIVLNSIMLIAPVVFSYVSKYEDYKNPRTALYITLIRTYILGAAIIGTSLVYWLSKAEVLNCWEDYLAAEIYRLIVYDFIFSVIVAALIEICYLMIQKFRGNALKFEFNISKHTLQIVYNQALFWVGFFYSPILPVIVTLKMLVIWYISEGRVRKFCKPPKRTWRAAQTQTFFMMLIFISIVLIVAVHGYTLKSITSSKCGPFQNYDFIYQFLTKNIANIENDNEILTILIFVTTKPGSVALILIALGILVYYFKEQAFAQKEKVRMLREMLIWVGKDKKVLVKWYSEATKGGDIVNFRNNRFFDDPASILPNESQPIYRSDLSTSRSSSMSESDDLNARFKKYS